MNQSGTSSAIVVLIVGLVIAFALWSGLTSIAKVIERKSFSHSVPASNNSDGIVLLKHDRFAVVKDYEIKVYEVDGSGKLRQTDGVDPRDRVPAVRPAAP